MSFCQAGSPIAARRPREGELQNWIYETAYSLVWAQMIEQTSLTDQPPQSKRLLGGSTCGPVVISVAALFAITLTLDPADCRPDLPEGPGITLDETFYVQMGVYLVDLAPREYGWELLNPFNLMDVFEAAHNPDHPPLGRLWLGVFHRIVQSVAPPAGLDDATFVTVSARFGSAVAFALTALVIGLFTGRRYGAAAGNSAALSLVLMPRLFGHAHLAALETFMNLVWTITVLATASLWTRGTRPGDRAAALTGLLLGAALLTKMQAILLPPLIGLWALWHWRGRAIRPLAIFVGVGCLVFVAGWPLLWLDFPGNLIDYFSRTTQRGMLHVWYLGSSLVDRDVPWHYPIVLFTSTLPVLILSAGILGAVSRTHSAFDSEAAHTNSQGGLGSPTRTLILGSVLAPLVLFSIPGVTVYDGVRLFLVAFPGWAILAGIGFANAYRRLTAKSRLAGIILTLVFVAQSVGLFLYHPHWLSFYGIHVGGLRGAEAIGLQTTYWSDSFSRSFLAEIVRVAPKGSTVEIAPVMHPSQWTELYQQSPLLQRREIRVQAFADPVAPTGDFLAVFHRRADVPSREVLLSRGWVPVSEYRTRGVTLASLWKQKK